VHEASGLLFAGVRPAASVCGLQASEAGNSFCVLGRAGVGIPLIFKLSSTNLPGTDTLPGWGNPPEAHKQNMGPGSSYTAPVLLALLSPVRAAKDKEV